MTLTTLIIWIAIVAIVLTLAIGFGYKKPKSWVMTYLQNFTGALFVFSGWVKAVDPLGTAYKMEQYFSEFQYTFQETWMSFLAPLFPWLSNYSVGFSVFMIVFEIVLGLMLIMGMKSKLTSWLFLLLVGFFTFLTGFTYLTGYVPEGVNFFNFSGWGPYKATNMKVTDCGCFGDFLKLEPKVSFFKDVALMIPALYFVFRHNDMHELFTKKIRNIIIGIATVGLLIYCMSNYVWDLPHADFRPFRKGADVASIKAIEEEADANVQTLSYTIKNENTNEQLDLAYADYISGYATKYNKKDGWRVIDEVKTEPTVAKTKISDFAIEDFEGDYVTGEYLESEGYHFMVISHKVKGEGKQSTIMVKDTSWIVDTIQVQGTDELQIVRSIDKISDIEESIVDYTWKPEWKKNYIEKIKPILDKAKAAGYKSSVVLGGADANAAADLAGETGINTNYYTADDILLKTIVRSNPGLVLWKDGTIVNKWHINKLPDYEAIKAENIQ